MQYRQLGSSSLRVSESSLGSWLTYSGGVEKRDAIACVKRALDLGINFIDTANVYGRGASETLLGEVLAKVDRASYVLATKLYFPMSDTDRGLSAAQIAKQIDASLVRLRTDYVDLYQCHRYDVDTLLTETMRAPNARSNAVMPASQPRRPNQPSAASLPTVIGASRQSSGNSVCRACTSGRSLCAM